MYNTLVCLPTGMGKTLIAAVVMYNFYRWFPKGQIIFMAHTKPLLSQQLQACYNIVGVPESDTAEIQVKCESAKVRTCRDSLNVCVSSRVLLNLK